MEHVRRDQDANLKDEPGARDRGRQVDLEPSLVASTPALLLLLLPLLVPSVLQWGFVGDAEI
jgi:hypothetical protein